MIGRRRKFEAGKERDRAIQKMGQRLGERKSHGHANSANRLQKMPKTSK